MSDFSHVPLTAPAAGPVPEPPLLEPAAIVRHLAQEIRQPLSAIESIVFYLDMVLPRTEGKARRQLGKLQGQVRQINWILSDAIQFLQAAPAHFQLLDLAEIVAKNVSEWNPAEAQMVRLTLEQNLPPVRLDLGQTQQLLRNLVGFFRRISEQENPIEVRTFAHDGGVRMEIAAAVPAGPREEIAPLLAPPAPGWPHGSALALASVRRVAATHGARVAVHSDPGGTLSVVVTFPPADRASESLTRTNSASAAGA